MEPKTKATRKNTPPLKVYCLPDERKEIEENAAKAGMSVAAYLRTLGLNYEIRGVLDSQAVVELSRVNADLGRLGGLLKMWLTNDEKLIIYDQAQLQKTIFDVLLKIKDNQEVIADCAKKVSRF